MEGPPASQMKPPPQETVLGDAAIKPTERTEINSLESSEPKAEGAVAKPESSRDESMAPDERQQLRAVRERLGLPAENTENSESQDNSSSASSEPTILDAREETPFAEKLSPTNLDSRTVAIKTLESRPDKLVREHLMLEGENLAKLEKSAVEGKKLFEQMSEKHGIKVVPMDFIIGKNDEGKSTLFTIVDKINGESLEKIKELPAEATDEIEGLYISLGKHYYDAWEKKEKYWADFQNDQFMFGTKSGEQGSHVYLVDVGAQFYFPGESKRIPETNEEMHPLEWVLYNVCEGLVKSEGKFHPEIHFEKARQQLLEEVEKILKANPTDKWLLKSKSVLES